MAAAIQWTMAKAKMIFTDQKDEYEYWTVRERQFVEVPVVSALYNWAGILVTQLDISK